MKLKIVLLALVAFCLSNNTAYGWGQKGHDITCAIAQRHLSKKAKKHISDLLDGRSIVYWSSWMDNASHSKEYAYTSTWHYRNIDADQTYDSQPRNPNGDVVLAINDQIRILKDKSTTREEKVLALKFLVHLVGDLHCPMHMGHVSDRGGNRWQVQFFDRATNLHSIFDSDMVESAHKWTHTEWAQELDILTPAEQALVTAGDVDTWGRETYAIASKLYETTPIGSKLSYDFVYEWTEPIEQQFLRGGLRLAKVLNDIFK